MVRRSVRVLLVLVVAAAAVVAVTGPAAAKLPPFTVTANPTTVGVGEPVTVEIALRDPSFVVPENVDLGPELRQMLSVRAVLPSGTPDAAHAGELLVPTRVSSSVWQAAYVPKRAGEFAIVTFDNVKPSPVNDYVPAPVPITVRAAKTVAVAASGARATPAGDAARPAPATSETSSSSSTMTWFAAGVVVALAAAAVWFVRVRRRRTRTRVA
jgi:hypothetical protein